MKWILLLGLMIVPAFAIEVEYFRFSNSRTYTTLDDALLKDSLVSNGYPWIATAAYDYVKVPLSIQTDNRRTGEVVKSLTGIHLGGGYRISDDLFLGARTYAARVEHTNTGTYLGDLALEGKWRVFQEGSFAMALAPAVYLPTGTQTFTTNRNKTGGYLGVNLEKRYERVQLTLNVGFSNQPGATYGLGSNFSSVDLRQAIRTALGAYVPFSEDWGMNLEVYRMNQLQGDLDPNEAYLGVRHQTTSSLQGFAGLSFGDLSGESANDYRLSLGLKFTPFAESPASVPVERVVLPLGPREEGLRQEKELYGTLAISETIYFANASKELIPFWKSVIKRFQNQCKRISKDYTIVIEGHASKTGSHEFNLRLSQERANETRRELESNGIPGEKIKEVGYGDSAVDLDLGNAVNRKVYLRAYMR